MLTDQKIVSRITRASKSNFYYSFLFLPRARREAIHALYAFCREVDDSVDREPDPDRAAERVRFWREELAACYDGDPGHPVTRSLSAHVRRFPVRREDLDHVIDGVEMDITRHRYATFEDLRDYCYKVASAVGLACIEIFGYRDAAARDYAVALGLAFQLTNILRDVGGDARRGRIYLPQQDMREAACPEEDLLAARPTPALVRLLAREAARARELFAQARSLLPAVDRRALFAAEIMRGIYEAILDKIEAGGFDVLAGKVCLSRPRKLAIATRCWLGSRVAARA